jgi:N utilization substance protein A
VNELKGEKVDIVEWDDDPKRFIAEALSPARVQDVQIDEDENTAVVIVPDHQLSLAIGKEGQNARLAARLSGYRIDIRSESQALGLDEDEEDDGEYETVEQGDGATATPVDVSDEAEEVAVEAEILEAVLAEEVIEAMDDEIVEGAVDAVADEAADQDVKAEEVDGEEPSESPEVTEEDADDHTE